MKRTQPFCLADVSILAQGDPCYLQRSLSFWNIPSHLPKTVKLYSLFPTDMRSVAPPLRDQPSSDLVSQHRCAAKFELVTYPLETDYITTGNCIYKKSKLFGFVIISEWWLLNTFCFHHLLTFTSPSSRYDPKWQESYSCGTGENILIQTPFCHRIYSRKERYPLCFVASL